MAKAVSPIIATVLIIGIAISASSMIYIWSKGFIAEQIEKFGDPIETACQQVKFDAYLSSKGGMEGYYELVINNQGNVNIIEISVKVIQGGKTVIKSFSQNGGISKGETGIINFGLEEFNLDYFDSIEVTPMLLGKGRKSGRNKLHSCKEQVKTGLRAEVQL